MTNNGRRAIAALDVELEMTEAHVRKLSSIAPASQDPNQRREIAALIKEENELNSRDANSACCENNPENLQPINPKRGYKYQAELRWVCDPMVRGQVLIFGI